MTHIYKVVSWLSDPALKTSESVPRSNHSTNSKSANTRRVLFNDLKRDAISLADAPQLLYHPVDLLISAECTVEISQSVIGFEPAGTRQLQTQNTKVSSTIPE